MQRDVTHNQAQKKSDKVLWLILVAWVVLSFGVLLQFEPPQWIASYCQVRPSL